MAFECQYCGKHLTRRYYLNCHLRRFHEDQLQSVAGSTPYIEPLACNLERIWPEENDGMAASEKQKKRQRNWGVSQPEYNRKLSLGDKLPNVWEQRTGQQGLGSPSADDAGEPEDDQDDVFSSDSGDADNEGENTSSDAESGSEAHSSSTDESGDAEDDDRDAPFDTLLWRAYQKLPEGAGTKEFKKMFRQVFICFEIHRKQLVKSPSYLKIKDIMVKSEDNITILSMKRLLPKQSG